MIELLEYKILELGTYVLRVSEVLSLVAFLLFATGFFIVLKKIIYQSKSLDLAKKFSISKLSRYLIVILSIIIGMHILGPESNRSSGRFGCSFGGIGFWFAESIQRFHFRHHSFAR